MAEDTDFSFVIATLGEAPGIDRLFRSLRAQSWKRFEVIVVDQNGDDRLDETIAKYAGAFPLRRIRCARGLSKARNRGIEDARAPLVGFPDDDCWYQPTFVERLYRTFAADAGMTGLTCLCLDDIGRLAAGGGSRHRQTLTKENVWGLGVSATIFLRRSIFDEVGNFDEGLGLGAPTVFQSGEETDLLLRIIAAGHRITYDPRLAVHHPAEGTKDKSAELKAWHYGVGMGRVLRLHDYAALDVLKHLAKPTFGALTALTTNQQSLARVRWARARGRLRGLLYARPNGS